DDRVARRGRGRAGPGRGRARRPARGAGGVERARPAAAGDEIPGGPDPGDDRPPAGDPGRDGEGAPAPRPQQAAPAVRGGERGRLNFGPLYNDREGARGEHFPMETAARQIVAFGGGGFSMESGNPLLDDYVLGLTRAERPRVCFLPSASGDADHYIVRFYRAF